MYKSIIYKFVKNEPEKHELKKITNNNKKK